MTQGILYAHSYTLLYVLFGSNIAKRKKNLKDKVRYTLGKELLTNGAQYLSAKTTQVYKLPSSTDTSSHDH